MRYTLQGARPNDYLRILVNSTMLIMEKSFPANQRWEQCGSLHLHPRQDEFFKILEGMLSLRLADEERTYVAGEAFEIARGTPHLICNRSRKPARALWKVRPALNTAELYELTCELSKNGRLDNLLQQAVIAWTYRDIYKPTSPPLWIQPVIFAPLAWIGRLLGYKAHTTQ